MGYSNGYYSPLKSGGQIRRDFLRKTVKNDEFSQVVGSDDVRIIDGVQSVRR